MGKYEIKKKKTRKGKPIPEVLKVTKVTNIKQFLKINPHKLNLP